MEQRIIAQFTNKCGCSATGTDDKSTLSFNQCALHAAAPKLLSALKVLDKALTPHLEALQTSRVVMNRIERCIYDAAIDARSAIKAAKP